MNSSNPITINDCLQFETLILESIDSVLSMADQAKVDAHLPGCAACQAFQREQRRLDSLLADSLAPRKLPVNFKANMLARVASVEARQQNAGQLFTTHGSLDATESNLRFCWGDWILPALDWLGYAAVAIAAIVVAGEMSFSVQISWQSVSTELLQFRAGLATAALSVAAGLWLGVRNRSGRWFEWV